MQRLLRLKLAFLLIFFSVLSMAQAASIEDARNLYHAGKLKSALADTNELLKADPESVSALFLKAQIQSESRAVEKAIDTYTRLIELQPSHLQAYNNLAALYAQQGKLELASKTLEQAIQTDPVFTTIYANLRAIYTDISKQHYRKALKLKAEKPKTQYASIDISDGTEQILSEEVLAVPLSIQAAINTTVANNTVVKKSTSRPLAAPSVAPAPPTPDPVVASKPKPVAAPPKTPAPVVASKSTAQAVVSPEPVRVVSAETKVPGKLEKKPEKEVEKKPVAKAREKLAEKPKESPETDAKIDPEREVKVALLAWANAWSNRHTKQYVAAYVNTYATPGKNNKQWAASRRWNFKNKKYIKVTLSNIRIQRDGKRYRVKFMQQYESDNYQDMVNKELLFVKQDERWRISREITY